MQLKSQHSSRGFGLITLLVMSVVGLIVMLGSTATSLHLFRSERLVRAQAIYDSLRLSLRSVLTDQSSCNLAFQKPDGSRAVFSPPNQSTISKISSGDQVMIEVGQNHQDSLQIDGLRLRLLESNFPPMAPPQALNRYFVELELETSIPNYTRNIRSGAPILIHLLTDQATGEIQTCYIEN